MGSPSSLHFIIGIGRSGTTLVSNELNKIKGVLAVPEMVFLIFFLQKFKGKELKRLDLKLVVDQIKTYGLSHPWVGWRFNEQLLLDTFDIELDKGKVSFQRLCEMVYLSFESEVSHQEIHTIIDKNPSYSLFANKLSHFLPESKFILIARDYRANILSRKQSVYLKSGNLVYNAVRWHIFNKNIIRFRNKSPKRVFTITYENFIVNTENNMKNVSQFLQIPSEQKVFVNNKDFQPDRFEILEKYSDRYSKKYSDLSKPINPSRKEVWKDQLSEKEIFLCDLFCGKTGAALGYEMVNKIPTSQKVLNHIKFFLPVCKAYVDVYKDYIIYYLHPKLKLKILKKKYKKIGFIKGK